MSAPLISYRSLDSNGDPQWGQGQSNFLTDIEAVALLIQTRLKLFKGEWWENQNDGLPLWQSILGGSANGNKQSAIAALISQRIQSTIFVIGLSNVSTSYNPNTRSYTYSAVVQTQFGNFSVTNIPTPPPQGLS